MEVTVSNNEEANGERAAKTGIAAIKMTIAKKGEARIIIATGASQFEMFKVLVKSDIDWSKVTVFHLDEYVGISESHPASFRKYLKERFEQQLPQALKEIYYLDPASDCINSVGSKISEKPIDVAFVGIGENGHLAFNDPPADFNIETPYLIVDLDEGCRQQQVNEGWFPTLEAVPKQAVSMSVKQIMKSQFIICTVPGERKANAVQACIEGEVTNLAPASILQQHDNCSIFLDENSAGLLKNEVGV
ncbi:MAG: glucosamine-6-phosphate deaminase [Lentisphaeraceae bacterium]|nr:glucosamine-6-phosphate deaminase [Lentisphaeraceae bacterium]